jgi:diguanylate cyclase (GGDEF)-like protein/PAS domain S-box-containing protein
MGVTGGHFDVASGPSDLHATIVENLFDGVYYVDRQRTITYWNPAAERISGYRAEEVVGRRCFDNILRHVNDGGDQLCFSGCPLVAAMAQRRGVEAEVYLHHADGHRVPVHVRCQPVRESDGTVVGAVEIFNEDKVYREAMHRIDDLERLSSTDALTGLVNRRTAEMSLRSRHRDLQEAGWPLGVLFVDIDHFKRFNDAHGHAAGDAVLGVVARSIANGLRESDLAARWGGEEFLVVTAAATELQILQIAERVRTLVAASDTSVDGRQLGVTVSVGAALATPADTVEALVARADRAMYESKAGGRNRTTLA